MNNLYYKLGALACLLFSSTFLFANTFDIEAVSEDPITEILDDRFAVITYEIENLTNKDISGAGIDPSPNGRMGSDGVKVYGWAPGAVTQIYPDPNDPHKPVYCGGTAIDMPVDEEDDFICGHRFSLKAKSANSCFLKLCVNGSKIPEHQQGEHKEKVIHGGPFVCTVPNGNPPGYCYDPEDQEDILNIAALSPRDAPKFIIKFPSRGENRPHHLAILEPGKSFVWELRNISDKTIYDITVDFTADILSQLVPGSINVSDCAVFPKHRTCEISVRVKPDANPVDVRKVIFQGINAAPRTGHVAIEIPNALEIIDGCTVFEKPGDRSMKLRNKTGTPITINFGDITFTGTFGVSVTPPKAGSCPYNAVTKQWTVPANSDCTIDLHAEQNAYIPRDDHHGKDGKVHIKYNDETLAQYTEGCVVVVDTVVEINHDLPIEIPGGFETKIKVPVENVGYFDTHDLKIGQLKPPLPGINVDSSRCPKVLKPINKPMSTCELTITTTGKTAKAQSTLSAHGLNFEEVTVPVIVGNVVIHRIHHKRQHLQCQGIEIKNGSDSSDPARVILKDIDWTENMDGEIEWCEQGDESCAKACNNLESTCKRDYPLLPGEHCIAWVNSIGNNENPYVKKGDLFVIVEEIDTNESETFKAVFDVTKDMSLYATGSFFFSGDKVWTHNISKWNGEEWLPLGNGFREGLIGPGRALSVYNGDLIVGGPFVNAGLTPYTAKIARWNGTRWLQVRRNNDNIFNGNVYSLLTANGKLYATGNFSFVGGFTRANGIAEFDGHKWYALGNRFGNGSNNDVLASASYRDNPFFGGEFTFVGEGDPIKTANHTNEESEGFNIKANHVAGWVNNNSWHVLGTYEHNGTNNSVYALLGHHNDFLVGGAFNKVFGDFGFGQHELNVHHIAKWDGSKWNQLAHNDYEINKPVHAINRFNDKYFIGGDFHQNIEAKSDENTYINYVAYLDGDTWKQAGVGIDGRVLAFTTHGSYIYAGGSFANDFNNVAAFDGEKWHIIDNGIGGQNVSYPKFHPKVNALLVTHSVTISDEGRHDYDYNPDNPDDPQ